MTAAHTAAVRSFLACALAVAAVGEVSVILRVETSGADVDGADVSPGAGADAAFLVGGSWTLDRRLCGAVAPGEVVEHGAVLSAWPTQLRLRGAQRTPPLVDAWGVRRISVVHVASGRTLVALSGCAGYECRWRQGSNHWIDSDEAYSTYDVPPFSSVGREAVCGSFACPSDYTFKTGTFIDRCRGNQTCTVLECCDALAAAAPSGDSIAAGMAAAIGGAAGGAAAATCTRPAGELGLGVSCQDGSKGAGYIMYSASSVHARFGGLPPRPGNAEHFVCARYSDGNWQYDCSSAWHTFRAAPTDVLVAKVDFDFDTVVSLEGLQEVHQGMDMGYASGDLEFTANRWNGLFSRGNIMVSGTSFAAGPGCGSGSDTQATDDAKCLLEKGIDCHLHRWLLLGVLMLAGSCLICCGFACCWRTWRHSAASKGKAKSAARHVVKPEAKLGAGVTPSADLGGGGTKAGDSQLVLEHKPQGAAGHAGSTSSNRRIPQQRESDGDVAVLSEIPSEEGRQELRMSTGTRRTSLYVAQEEAQQELGKAARERVQALQEQVLQPPVVYDATVLPNDRFYKSHNSAASHRIVPTTDLHLLGTWLYGNTGGKYRISMTGGGQLRIDNQLLSGRQVSGLLKAHGEWFQAEFHAAHSSGQPLGSLRLQRHPGVPQSIRLQFKSSNKPDWGPPLIAIRDPDGSPRLAPSEADHAQESGGLQADAAEAMMFSSVAAAIDRSDNGSCKVGALEPSDGSPAPAAHKFGRASPASASIEQPCVPHPRGLCVVSPTVHVTCVGEYLLVEDERANDHPLWMHTGGSRWIYSGVDGKWYIGGQSSKGKGFACSSGFICSSRAHGGAMPDHFDGLWEAGDGKDWVEDRAINVIALTPLWLSSVRGRHQEVLGDQRASLGATPLGKGDTSAPLAPEPEEDSPGAYVVIHNNTAVTVGVSASPPVVAHLGSGMQVSVLEVVRCEMEQRVRGRIASPAGWISLLNTEDGYRWAKREVLTPNATSQAHDLPGNQGLVPLPPSPSAGFSEASFDDTGSWHSRSSRDRSLAPASIAVLAESLQHSAAPPMLPGVSATAPKSGPPPAVVSIQSPNGQHERAGDYTLVVGRRPNGQPLWQQKDGPNWLYSGKTGRWCVGSQDVLKKEFNTSAGWLYQATLHHGAYPWEVDGIWARWDGKEHCRDADIGVRPVWVASAVPDAVADTDIAALSCRSLEAERIGCDDVEASLDVVDLRGGRLSQEGKQALNVFKRDTLRVVV